MSSGVWISNLESTCPNNRDAAALIHITKLGEREGYIPAGVVFLFAQIACVLETEGSQDPTKRRSGDHSKTAYKRL